MSDFLISADQQIFGPSIARVRGGQFVAVWTDHTGLHIKGRRFLNGGAFGPEFDVNTTTNAGEQNLAVVARARDNGFAVAWISNRRNVLLQLFDKVGNKLDRFDGAGQKIEGDIKVNTSDANGERRPGIACLLSGDLVVTWTDARAEGGVRAQMFFADGLKRGGEIEVHSSPGVNVKPVITELDPGGFAIAWLAGEPGFTPSVRAQVFGADGAKVGEPIKGGFTPVDDEMAIAFLVSRGAAQRHFSIVYRQAADVPDVPPGAAALGVLRVVIAALFTPRESGPQPAPVKTNVTSRSAKTIAADVAITALPSHRVAVTWSERKFEQSDHNIKVMVLTEHEERNAQGQVIAHILLKPDPPPPERIQLVNETTAGQQRLPQVAFGVSPHGEDLAFAWHDNSVPGRQSVRGRVRSSTLLARDGNGKSVIYAVEPGGNLKWFQDAGREIAGVHWNQTNSIGSGWEAPEHVFAGAGNIIYLIDLDGVFKKYVHLGASTGEKEWVNGTGQIMPFSFGDSILRAWGGLNNAIYLADENDDLFFLRDRGATLEAADAPIGRGWATLPFVFAGMENVIYKVDEEGRLIWQRHLGVAEGSDNWSSESVISTGLSLDGISRPVKWTAFKRVFSPHPTTHNPEKTGGFIYMIAQNGLLYRTRHIGWKDGDPTLLQPQEVGSGWQTFVKVFAGRT